jgi:hypothetical protein
MRNAMKNSLCTRRFDRVEIVDNATAYCHFRVPAVVEDGDDIAEVCAMVKDPAGSLLVCENPQKFRYTGKGMHCAPRMSVKALRHGCSHEARNRRWLITLRSCR